MWHTGLRDFISATLSKSIGSDWVDKCGVTAERIEKWKERQEIEKKRQESGVVETRILYYADFYDLGVILKKHWSGDFSKALGDQKTFLVWLTELEKLRDPDAHRRELLPHQKHLALGISGEIRTRIVRFRSMIETAESFFPRIECVRDSLGSIWTTGNMRTWYTGKILHPGDTLDLVITATDPMEEQLQYAISIDTMSEWTTDNSLSIVVDASHIGKDQDVAILIRSPREYHASRLWDDSVFFKYDILPLK